jgi:hypothetical protein
VVLDALIGKDTDTGEDVFLAYDDRPRGVAIIGKPGTGKSSLLEHLILTDLRNGTPGVVIDPHGLLAERVISLAPPEHAKRIILLNPSETTFGLNLLACRKPAHRDDHPAYWAADSVVQAVKKLYGEDDEYLPRLEHYLDLAAHTLIPNNGNLTQVTRLFRNAEFREACVARVTDEGIHDEWQSYDSLRPIDQRNQIEAVVNRLTRMLRPPLIKGIVGCSTTTVPFDAVLAGNSMLIVSVPSDRLSPERCNFIGSLVLCALADRIFLRQVTAAGEPPRVHIYLDEYQRFATTTTVELLEQGRKYGAGVTMAHQSLYQITDPKIRNASRQAATLIVLAVAHSDAELLAGEFPIKPREEWVETLEERDGVEPRLVPSPTPAEDIYLYGHSNEWVDLLARSFFAPTAKYTAQRIRAMVGVPDPDGDIIQYDHDPRKSAGVPPRPGGRHIDRRLQLTAYDLNGLLYEAMAGQLLEPEALLQKLLWCQTWTPTVRLGGIEHPLRDIGVSTMYYYLSNESVSRIPTRTCDCPPIDPRATREPELSRIGPRRPRSSGDALGLHLSLCDVRPLTRHQKAHNDVVERAYLEEARDFVKKVVEPWLRAHLIDDRQALRECEPSAAHKKADHFLAVMAWFNCWNGRWQWSGRVSTDGPGKPAAIPNDESTMDEEFFGKRADEFRNMCTDARQRLHFLDLLCEALYKEPVLVPSGEQKPRTRTRHIVHSAQTYQDALNEFASKLVHPPRRHVASARLPHTYHPVKLQPAAPGTGSAPQLVAAQDRAALYECNDKHGQEPSAVPPPPPPSRISRVPRDTSPDAPPDRS